MEVKQWSGLLKAKIFPCSEKMQKAIDENKLATDRLIAACSVHPCKKEEQRGQAS